MMDVKSFYTLLISPAGPVGQPVVLGERDEQADFTTLLADPHHAIDPW
jgi:hypothetical protein